MERNIFSIILSGISIFLSIIAIYTSRPYNWELNFIGLTVAVLSILVTILIGWNILSLVDFNKRRDEMVTLQNKMKNLIKLCLEENERSKGVANKAAADMYYSMLGLENPLGNNYSYLYHSLLSIMQFSTINDIETCNSIVKAFLTTLNDPSKILIQKHHKKRLLLILSKIRNCDKIESITELQEKIALLNTTT